jgi:hypothetical protein
MSVRHQGSMLNLNLPTSDEVTETTSTEPRTPRRLSQRLKETLLREKVQVFKGGYTVEDVGAFRKLLYSIRCQTITVLVILFAILLILFNAIVFGVFPTK